MPEASTDGKIKVSVLFERELVNAFDLVCFEEKKSRSELIRELVANFLGAQR